MHKLILALAAAGLMAVGGCASTGTNSTTRAANEPTKSALSDEAKKALADAEADVKAAKAKEALWTTAEDALKKAQEASKKGDSAETVKQAKYASGQAKLGIEQKTYPPLTAK